MRIKIIEIIALFALLAACAPSKPPATTGPSVEEIVSATISALTVAAPPTQPAAGSTSYQNVSFVLTTDVATSALAGTIAAIPATTDGPGWDVAPAYIKFQLDNYQKFSPHHLEPIILVYPAQEYAAANESAKRNIEKLQALLNGSAALTAENLPRVATFNAAQAFAAQIQILPFHNGSGVRFLNEYAQYSVTANNEDLFYQFQGLTSDGKYYIIAILPVSNPLLTMDPDPASTIPSGGIPFPGVEDSAALANYYPAVVNLLNSAAPNTFQPALSSLDALIQSLIIVSQ